MATLASAAPGKILNFILRINSKIKMVFGCADENFAEKYHELLEVEAL
jgi:hypothetical protein